MAEMAKAADEPFLAYVARWRRAKPAVSVLALNWRGRH